MTGKVPETRPRWYRPRSLRRKILLWLAPWILTGAVVVGGFLGQQSLQAF